MLILFTVINHFDASVVPDLILCALFLCHNSMFQAHLAFSLLQPWDQPFLKGPLVPFSGE